MTYRVLIVDDQKMQRKALEAFLQDCAEFEIVESLASAELAVSFCQKNTVDLVLMDVVMTTGISGIEATARIKSDNPKIKVILVTSMPEASYLHRAKEVGADSLWYKEYEEEPLLQIIERTMAGESIYPDKSPALQLGNAKSTDFTDRELEVLRKIVTGATDQEIADMLYMSVWTVRSHLQHMLQKTGYQNRVELAVNARASGLIIDE